MKAKLIKYLGYVPDIIVLVCTIVLLADLIVSGLLGTERWLSGSSVTYVLAVALAGLTVSIIVRNEKIDKALDRISVEKSSPPNIIPSAEVLDLSDQYLHARNVDILTISGTKLARLGDSAIFEQLIKNLSNKEIRILIANPRSSALQLRYENDEPASYEIGLSGVEKRINYLYGFRKQLKKSMQNCFQVRIYDSYPTMSILRIDRDYIFTVFGYKLRASDCPKTLAIQGDHISNFLKAQFNNIWKDSIEINEWVEKQTPQIEQKDDATVLDDAPPH